MMELEARGISAGYGSGPILHHVSLSLKEGELVGLIGPNGCGKSTLLRCLSRVMRIDSGSVVLDGRNIASWTPREIAQRLAFVPQHEGALFEFSVRDLVLMGRHPHVDRWKGETDRDYRIVTQSLADADILHLAERPVTQLSGGEHRRVLLARALAQQTPLLLLDEPTAHLDVTHQAELLTLVQRRSRARGQGALAALHDLNQAAQYCDRLILMCRGQVVSEGAPETVLSSGNLRTAYAADIQVGCNPGTGRPMLLSVHPTREAASQAFTHHVHVICGGGTGIGAMGSLVRAGFQVTAGVLNRLDSDHAAAEALAIETAVEAPFSPIGPDAREACVKLVARANSVLITPVPIGRGNLAMLELALEAQKLGKLVIFVGDADPAGRDYTGGAAASLIERLMAGGAVAYADTEDWIASMFRGL